MNVKNANSDFARGNQLKQAGKWHDAIAAYCRAIELNPNFSWSYHNLADVLSQQGNWSEAIAYYQKAIEIEPQSAWSHHNLGEALVKQGRLDEAIACYQRAIELNSNFYGFYNNLGLALAKQGRLDEAISAYRRAIERYPKSASPHYNLGEALAKQGHLDDAIASYEKAISLNPCCDRAHYSLGKVRQQQGQSDEAISCYLKTISLQPKFQKPFVKLRHSFKLKPHQLELAIACYRQAIQNHPNVPSIYAWLGDLLTKQGNWQEAISCYKTISEQQTLAAYPEWFQDGVHLTPIQQPDFLIIGAMKGGTTSLYKYLVGHPQIVPCIEKEVHYFSRQSDKPLDWYLAHFPSIPQGKDFLTGEASPSYYHAAGAEKRLFELFPNTKLIIILRNPIDRAYSHYNHMVNVLGTERRSFEEIVASDIQIDPLRLTGRLGQKPKSLQRKQKPYLSASLYVHFIKRWMSIFPREQFLILKSEDLYSNPAATMKQVFEFLGLPDYQLPQYPNYYSGSYKPLTDNLRHTLSDFFRPYNQELEEYLGMTFNWD